MARRLADEVKRLEHLGYSFEGAEASFEMVIHRARGHQPAFELVDYIALVEQREGNPMVSEATVKVRVGDRVVHTAAEGNGPVNALDAALRKALLPSYPEIDEMRLHDYKVRVIDESQATAAGVRVLIESGDRHQRWSTVGCSHQHHRGVLAGAGRRLRVRHPQGPRGRTEPASPRPRVHSSFDRLTAGVP